MNAGTEPDARCAVLARALDEPLAGTAPVVPRWVCLEHQGAWPRDVATHPDQAVAAFATRATAAGMMLLLIRRPGRRGNSGGDTGGPGQVYLADTAPPAARTTVLTVAGPSELVEITLPAPGAPLPGTPVADPLLLVCTHGRRDRCCALDGRALALALAAAGEPGVWECSHLGGHRFAPTALVLPTGYLYGRLDVTSAITVRKAAGSGEVETALCRGRSTWSPAGQVAELAVRAATGLRGADELHVLDAPGGAIVTARDGTRWVVDVRSEHGPSRPASCGADATPLTALRAAPARLLA
ncbi:MAG: sucrase ferredoxin [Pseudonocardia sp.]